MAKTAAADNLDTALVERARKLRPFYFIVVVWGEAYTDMLLNLCVASLLSPNNIPALLNSGNKFLIATTAEDWARMQDRPMFRLMKQYAEPVFFEMPPCPKDVHPVIHMGIGHKATTQHAFEDKAYGVLLTPDMMLSDGTVAAMQRRAVEGYAVMLTAALRFGQEPLFAHLKQLGVTLIEPQVHGEQETPVVAKARQLVWAGVRSFHSETLRYEWDKPCFHPSPSGVWWRVDDDGVIVHSLSWAPMVVDYASIGLHDSSMMDSWTIDGDYIFKNFGLSEKIYVVQDSDEMMQISWAPLNDRPQSLEPTSPKYLRPIIGEWIKGATFYSALSNPSIDPLKRKIFPLPVYWHAGEIDPEKWAKVERRALSVITKYGGVSPRDIAAVHQQYLGAGIRLLLGTQGQFVRRSLLAVHWVNVRLVRKVAVSLWYFGLLGQMLRYYWRNWRHVFALARKALQGDTEARMRVKRSVGYLLRAISGSSPY
jgi:hypothetical protein